MTSMDAVECDHAPGAHFSWRDHLAIHPAADQFPPMCELELRELAEDIRQHGLKNPIVLAYSSLCDESGKRTDFYTHALIDGRNRLDALQLLGWLEPTERPKKPFFRGQSTTMMLAPVQLIGGDDVSIDDATLFSFEDGDHDDSDDVLYAIAASLNLHRRHLTAEKKRELIAGLLKRDPAVSDRQIGETVKADNKTVAKVRAEMEGREEIPHVTERKDTKGRQQPAKRKQPSPKQDPAEDHAAVGVAPEQTDPEASAEARKALYSETITIEDDLEPNEYRQAFLLRSADAMAFATYSGLVDAEVIAAAGRVAAKWTALAAELEAGALIARGVAFNLANNRLVQRSLNGPSAILPGAGCTV